MARHEVAHCDTHRGHEPRPTHAARGHRLSTPARKGDPRAGLPAPSSSLAVHHRCTSTEQKHSPTKRGHMRFTHKLFLAALAALLLASLSASSATARTRIEISTTAMLASGRLIFTGGGGRITCDVTLHITALTRLINKIRGSLIGRVTSILTANPRSNFGGTTGCAGLVEPVRTMLVLFGSITGSLPDNIRGGRIDVAGGFLISLRVEFLGVNLLCLYDGRIEGIANENPILRVTVTSPRIPGRPLPGSDVCPEGELRGEMEFNPLVTVILLER
jgi:hypothetical protein